MMFIPRVRACWEVMECRRGDDCPARKYPARKCWEIARINDCHYRASDICRDCIVYLLQNEIQLFSEEELCSLAKRRVSCTCFLSRL